MYSKQVLAVRSYSLKLSSTKYGRLSNCFLAISRNPWYIIYLFAIFVVLSIKYGTEDPIWCLWLALLRIWSMLFMGKYRTHPLFLLFLYRISSSEAAVYDINEDVDLKIWIRILKYTGLDLVSSAIYCICLFLIWN